MRNNADRNRTIRFTPRELRCHFQNTDVISPVSTSTYGYYVHIARGKTDSLVPGASTWDMVPIALQVPCDMHNHNCHKIYTRLLLLLAILPWVVSHIPVSHGTKSMIMWVTNFV